MYRFLMAPPLGADPPIFYWLLLYHGRGYSSSKEIQPDHTGSHKTAGLLQSDGQGDTAEDRERPEICRFPGKENAGSAGSSFYVANPPAVSSACENKEAGFPLLDIHRATQEEADRFEDLLNSIEAINLYGRTVYDVVYGACGPCLAEYLE